MSLPRHSVAFIDLVRLSLRIFRTKPTRTFLTILGMSIGIGTVVFLVSLGYGLQYILIGKLTTSQDSLTTLSASYPAESSLNISTSTVAKIAGFPGAVETSAVAEFSGILTIGDSSGLVPIVRVAEESVFRLSGITPDIGTPLRAGKDDVVISAQALTLLNQKADSNMLGKAVRVELYLPNPDGTVTSVAIERPFTVAGIMSGAQEPPLVIIPTGSLSVPAPSYKEVFIRAEDSQALVTLRDLLTQQGFIISANIDLVMQAEKITNIITIVLAVFGITALIVSAIGMFNTMLIGFIERTYEIGIMKAVGATNANVRDLFFVESGVIGLLGGTGGLTIGIALSMITNAVLNFISVQMGGKTFNLFILPFWFGTFVFLISIVIGIIAGLLPAFRASRLSPREAFTKQ
ncbi:ABC transporter permease [Candidatus Kaiserbacteria bacterium]|nr:ABC transporter permease [Candidatus Kaiserbacteria bacterium]